jgi:hypothetical protein
MLFGSQVVLTSKLKPHSLAWQYFWHTTNFIGKFHWLKLPFVLRCSICRNWYKLHAMGSIGWVTIARFGFCLPIWEFRWSCPYWRLHIFHNFLLIEFDWWPLESHRYVDHTKYQVSSTYSEPGCLEHFQTLSESLYPLSSWAVNSGLSKVGEKQCFLPCKRSYVTCSWNLHGFFHQLKRL